MLPNIDAFFDLLVAALTAGAMFGLWLGSNPSRLPAPVYVAHQQHAIRAMNVAMPLLGATTILLTLVGAYDARGDRLKLVLLMTAFGCFVAAGLITRFANQPLNAIVLTWSVDAPPATWSQLRDRWWHWHELRTAFAVAGLCVLIVADLGPVPGR